MGVLMLREGRVAEAERCFQRAAAAGDDAAADQLSRLRAKREEITGTQAVSGRSRELRRFAAVLDPTNRLWEELATHSDAELRELTDRYRRRLADGQTLEDLLPEAFATVREAAWRVREQRHFDVQIVGGAALHHGCVVEMKAGEGKTLTATLPAYLNALTGEGVHVVTVNDYLAKRDAEWMGAIYGFLGLSVGVILPTMTLIERRPQYDADITYGNNNEFGFDYLRDNMALFREDLVQRGHAYAIVDEVDLILIDEARTPLIISGPTEQGSRWHLQFARIAPRLERDVHYEVDPGHTSIDITDAGVARVEQLLGIDDLYDPLHGSLMHHLRNALRAKELYKRDREYIVVDGGIRIVDDLTGRVVEGRRYSDGLDQAIEAKEGLPITKESQTYASITVQNYFRMYDKLAGMTGTAEAEAAEFDQIYKLRVVKIPPNRQIHRIDRGDVVYKTATAKVDALIQEINERHDRGQPVLVGTTSISNSELISRRLDQRGIRHSVLNAKNLEQEAHIIAQAGRLGAVTVTTNMAGRGVDIMLGGNVDYLAEESLRAAGITPDEVEPQWAKALRVEKRAKARQVAAEHYQVVQLGGLVVLGTERHESRRVDDQLRGRSGRQGDPGESQFYLSLEDDVMRMFGALPKRLERLQLPDDVPIANRLVTRAIANAQHQFELVNFQRRKNVLRYDEVMNKQRQVIYETRRQILEGGEELHDQMLGFLGDVVASLAAEYCPQGDPEEWDLDGLFKSIAQLYPTQLDPDALDLDGLDRNEFEGLLLDDAERAYRQREAEFGADLLHAFERRVLLTVLDRHWREHLYEMDFLQEGIGLQAIGQRDPLIEYERQGFDMFQAMRDSIKREAVAYIFSASVDMDDQTEEPLESDETPEHVDSGILATSSTDEGRGGVNRGLVGRNQPCPCGSGRKYKLCHGAQRFLPERGESS
jgi:preprotein translocase subunit SecA